MLQAIAHKQTDFVPYHVEFSEGIKAAMSRELATDDLPAAMGDHLSRFSMRGKWNQAGPGLVKDDFGVIWDRSVDKDIGIAQPVLSTTDLEQVQWPSAQSHHRLDGLDDFFQDAKSNHRFKCFGLALSLFERAWALRGMDQLLMDMLEDPPFVDALLDRIVEHNLSMMKAVSHYDWDGVWIGDDWGQQRGLIMGGILWRRYILPRIRRMYEFAHQKGWTVIIHSCGDILELLPDLIEAGVDVLNPFQPEVMDLISVKREYGKDLTFLGGMSVQQVLPFGTPAQVRDESSRLLDQLGKDGGYIFAPSHMLTDDIPVANVTAMFEVIAAQNPQSQFLLTPTNS